MRLCSESKTTDALFDVCFYVLNNVGPVEPVFQQVCTVFNTQVSYIFITGMKDLLSVLGREEQLQKGHLPVGSLHLFVK